MNELVMHTFAISYHPADSTEIQVILTRSNKKLSKDKIKKIILEKLDIREIHKGDIIKTIEINETIPDFLRSFVRIGNDILIGLNINIAFQYTE